jgi:hypothetical protein
MASIDDLTAAVTQAAADESAEAAVIGQLTAAVQALVAALQTAGQSIPPAAQAAIDAAVSGLADVHTAVGVDTSALEDLTTEADGAVNPPAAG